METLSEFTDSDLAKASTPGYGKPTGFTGSCWRQARPLLTETNERITPSNFRPDLNPQGSNTPSGLELTKVIQVNLSRRKSLAKRGSDRSRSNRGSTLTHASHADRSSSARRNHLNARSLSPRPT